jgi:hypothetical protein
VWKEIGILDGIVASARRCNRNDTVLIEVAKFWSPRTNTFIFPWGEATVTLEDLAVLGGLPVLGSSVRGKQLPEIQADAKELERIRWILNDSKSKKPNFSGWVKHFLEIVPTDDTKQRLEHGAFLAMWLSTSVLKEAPFDVVNPDVFCIAAQMARGQGVALAPAALASLYRGLSSLKLHICSGDEVEFVVDTPLNVLQLWILERFPALRSKVEESSQEGLNSITVRGELESPIDFRWMPYSRPNVALRGRWISTDDIVSSRELQSFARYIHACHLVGMYYDTEKYNPHRVARQLGFDQDVPGTVARPCSDWKESWRRYDLNPEHITFFIPDSEPGVTVNYKKWWKNFICNKGISKKAMATAIGEGSSTSTGPGIKRQRQDTQQVNGHTHITFIIILITKKGTLVPLAFLVVRDLT